MTYKYCLLDFNDNTDKKTKFEDLTIEIKPDENILVGRINYN